MTMLLIAVAAMNFVTVDPGHFHAALVFNNPYGEDVSTDVRVYAPKGAELDAYLALLKSFNGRAESPTAWREDVYANGDYLGATPNIVLCSPSNYFSALNIYQSEQITGAGSEKGKNNVLRGLLQPITSQFIGNGTKYWLFNTAFPLMDVAFLNGRTTPVVETAEADFNQLGIQMRCYYDFGVGTGDTKAAVYSTGA